MSFDGKISGSLSPQGAKQGNVSGNIGPVVPDIRDGAVTTVKLADAAVTIAKLAQDVTALINSKGSASDVAQLQTDVAALQTITEGLGTASTYGVANNLTQAAAGANVLDAYQGKLLGDRMTTAEGDIVSLNDGYAKKDITTQLTVTSGWTVYGHQFGHLVVITFLAAQTQTLSNQYITICTLPASLRPVVYMRYTAYDNNATTANSMVAGVVSNTSGNVQVWPYYTGTKPCGTVCFLVD